MTTNQHIAMIEASVIHLEREVQRVLRVVASGKPTPTHRALELLARLRRERREIERATL